MLSSSHSIKRLLTYYLVSYYYSILHHTNWTHKLYVSKQTLLYFCVQIMCIYEHQWHKNSITDFAVVHRLLNTYYALTQLSVYWIFISVDMWFSVWWTGTNSTQHSSSTGVDADDCDGLYPGHIPTSLFQKVLLSLCSSAMAITCPWRGGMSVGLCSFFAGVNPLKSRDVNWLQLAIQVLWYRVPKCQKLKI